MSLTSEDADLYKEIFTVAEVKLEMEIDTGAARSIISRGTYREKFSHFPLQRSEVKLKAYNGGSIHVLGQITAQVVFDGQTVNLTLLVVKGNGSTLYGRNWLRKLKLNWEKIKQASV